MSEATTHVESEATREANAPRGRTRTCVGCNARVDLEGPDGADLVRLVLGPDGAIAVDAGSRHGGGFGRGAHVHARRACVERAAKAGLLRATKGAAKSVYDGESDKGEALAADSLARAIQRSMDRRIEGLLAASVRSRQVARGADAVTGACRRGEAELCVVACDAAAAADLTEVRRAVAEGRAVAWGTKARIGGIVAPAAVRGRLAVPSDPSVPTGPAPSAAGESPPAGSEGVAVVAILSRTIAGALRAAVQAASAVTATEVAARPAPPPRRGLEEAHGQSGSVGKRPLTPPGTGGARRARVPRVRRRDG